MLQRLSGPIRAWALGQPNTTPWPFPTVRGLGPEDANVSRTLRPRLTGLNGWFGSHGNCFLDSDRRRCGGRRL
eukprot:11732086-Alexandrium_andersonii.AAC.1